jgi:hypothetical protein
MAVKKKLLTPAKFGLNTMKPLSSEFISKTVLAKLNKLDITPATKNACKNMVQNSISGAATFGAEFNGLTGADIGVLTSDFGEVTGAIYMLNSNKGYTAAKFPTSEAQRLVDYYLVKDGVDQPFSAKAGQGGAPSINALEEKLNAMDPRSLTRKQQRALKVLQIINKESIYDGVLVAADYLKLPGYEALTSILKKRNLKTGYSGGIPKVENLMNAIDACGGFNSCMKEFSPLFSAANFQLGGDAGEKKMKSVFAGTAGSRYKKWGLLHFPITSEVMSWLNNPANGATEILTLAARTLTVNQIYLDHTPPISGPAKWKSGNLNYIIKTFSDASFKFHSPSSTPNPVGNRIGMKMIKG